MRQETQQQLLAVGNQSQKKEGGRDEYEDFRFVYNLTPSTKECAAKVVIPMGFHYTPLGGERDVPLFGNQDWLRCTKCGSFINKYCTVLAEKKLWICCICTSNNKMPSPTSIPPSLLTSSTFQISLQQKTPEKSSQNFLFLIDLCIPEKELQKIKQMIISFIEVKSEEKPEGIQLDTRISLITFSKYVFCYDWSAKFDSVFCIGADRKYESADIAGVFGVGEGDQEILMKKFVVGVQGKGNKERIIKRVRKMKAVGEVENDEDHLRRARSKRAYGQALNVALSLCELSGRPFRIVNTLGGPCTHGIGKVIDTSFTKSMRSITDLEGGQNSQNYAKAIEFYRSLIRKTIASGTAIDLLIFSLEETGLAEMRDLVSINGGLLVLGQNFDSDDEIFEKSFKKAYFPDDQNQMSHSLALSSFMQISCSNDILINGMLGNCHPIEMNKKTTFQCISERRVGLGGTNTWYLGSLDCNKSVTVVYELANKQASNNAYYIQVKTSYRNYWGMKITKIATVKKLWQSNISLIPQKFDQEAAIVLIVRWFLHRMQHEQIKKVRAWVDQLLIKWASVFASYIKGDQQSFSLPASMKLLPQFFYYFRRTPFYRKSGIAFDELIYQTHIFNRENLTNCLLIIEPALLSYAIGNEEPNPVRLQLDQMKGDVILLLDTYFKIVVWYGEHVQYWRSEEYHKQQEYEHVKNLLEAPEEDVENLLESRFPHPGFFRTKTNQSKQRFVKSKMSPKKELQNQNTITDDSSIQQFTRVLIQIIVNQKIS